MESSLQNAKNYQWKILSKKQDNGLWGIPFQCVKMDKAPMSKKNIIKHSALCIAISEAYKDETFEIFWSDENGFFVKLSKNGIKRIKYKEYKIKGNIIKCISKVSCVLPLIKAEKNQK
jgi:hypothetical protein